jgi:hypothetical protein
VIVACLNWYDEPATWLASTVASLKGVCDHVVAVDGPYFLYPGAMERPRSACDQADAVVQVADAINIGCTLHRPREAWAGNEVEKRNRLLALAQLEAGPGDWLLRIDGDEVITQAPHDLHARLRDAEEDVAEVTLWRRTTEPSPMLTVTEQQPLRALYRNVPGLRIEGTHHTYVTADGRYLGGFDSVVDLEPALDALDLRIEHRHDQRMQDRNHQAVRYYRMRDRLGIEQSAAPLPA